MCRLLTLFGQNARFQYSTAGYNVWGAWVTAIRENFKALPVVKYKAFSELARKIH